SAALSKELDKMRTYRKTEFGVDPKGFDVATTADDGVAQVHHEKKIDLPETWVKGFLQVHCVMSLSLTKFRMAPVDFFNICRALKKEKTKKSPRALRYELTPGEPVQAVLEPWGKVVPFDRAFVYEGPKPKMVRTWGRDRLQLAVRLLPLCRYVDVYLAGDGLPSVYVFDLGDLIFTLGLSGWTDNDWTSGGAKFDLLTRPTTASSSELKSVYDVLRTIRFGEEVEISTKTGLSTEKTRSVLSYLCQAGRVMVDLAGGVYRQRDLFPEPFDPKAVQQTAAAATTADPAAKTAEAIEAAGGVRIIARRTTSTGFKLSGSCQGKGSERLRPQLHVDHDGKIIDASCTCSYFTKHQLTKGPCEHMLALRLIHMKDL
ncbi:MAG: SWIM zinc finger family protein, partial [Planctomycetia bacterium]